MNESDLAAILKANPDLRLANTGGLERPPLIPDIGNHDLTDEDEDQAQIKIFNWAKDNEDRYPCLHWMFHVPNGEYRPKATGAKLKRMGVKPAVPDIWLPHPVGRYNGLVMELKRFDRSNKPSPDQLEWLDWMGLSGWIAIVAYGSQSAITSIANYITGNHAA